MQSGETIPTFVGLWRDVNSLADYKYDVKDWFINHILADSMLETDAKDFGRCSLDTIRLA